MISLPNVVNDFAGFSGINSTRSPNVCRTDWGYIVRDGARRPLRVLGLTMVAWIAGVLLSDVALGVWLLSPTSISPASLVLKLGATLACVLLAWQFFVLANGDGPRELQMDHRKGQARLLLRHRVGRPSVLATMRMSNLCAFTVRPLGGPIGDARRSALMLTHRGSDPVEVLRGPTAHLEQLCLRLEMDRATFAPRRACG